MPNPNRNAPTPPVAKPGDAAAQDDDHAAAKPGDATAPPDDDVAATTTTAAAATTAATAAANPGDAPRAAAKQSNGPNSGTQPIATAFRPAPPPGIYIQAWVARMRDPERELRELAAGVVRDGLQGVVIHGFPRGLPRAWPRLMRAVTSQGTLALAAFGLDGTKDTDGTPLTPKEKGECVAQVAADRSCSGTYLDAEGRWDRDAERAAIELGEALRKGAPDAWVGDQPWFAIDSHGELARSAMPDDKGGVFRGFPVDEFALSCVNGDRARQAYWANFFRQWGDDAYERIISWMERDWSKIRPAMTARGLARTEAVTIQGYGHRKHGDVVDCAVDWAWSRGTRVVVWSEPVPERIAYEALRAAAKIRSLGFAPDGVPAGRAIRDAQAALGVFSDGVVGPETLRALGIRN